MEELLVVVCPSPLHRTGGCNQHGRQGLHIIYNFYVCVCVCFQPDLRGVMFGNRKRENG